MRSSRSRAFFEVGQRAARVVREDLGRVGAMQVMGVGLLLAGCPSTTTTALPTEAEFSAQFPMAACDAIEACAGATVADVFFAASGGCDATFGAPYRNALVPAAAQATARGTVRFSPERARACLDALVEDPCTVGANGRAAIACQSVYVGTTPAGGACSLNEECGPSQFSSLASGCPGACQPRRNGGQPCGEDRHCTTGYACESAVCVEARDEGDTCDDARGCGLGFLCSAGRCMPADEVLTAAEGQACHIQMGPLCREGLSCVVDTLVPGGATFVCRTRLASGSACRIGLPSSCQAGLACAGTNLETLDLDGTCMPVPNTDGAACEAVSGCAEGFRCVDGACIGIRDNGASCTTATQCASGQCTGGVCAAPQLCPASRREPSGDGMRRSMASLVVASRACNDASSS